MKVAVHSSDVEELLPSAQVDMFRLSPNLEYLAVVISNRLTLFQFKKSLNQFIEVETAPSQIEFIGEVMAVRFINASVNFYQLKIVQGKPLELQIIRFGPTNVLCELMQADTTGRKFVMLGKSELSLAAVGATEKSLVLTNYPVQNCRLTANSQLAVRYPSLFSTQSVVLFTGAQQLVAANLVSLEVIPGSNQPVKMVAIPTKLSNIVRVLYCQSGYLLLINNQLEAEMIASHCTVLSKAIKTIANSNKMILSQGIQLMSRPGRDVLVVYVEATNSVYQFEMGAIISAEDANPIKAVRRIKIKQKIWRFEVGCDLNTQFIMVVNDKGIKNLKLRQQDGIQSVDVPKAQRLQSTEFPKPKRVLQRQSKTLKPAAEPVAASSGVNITKPKTQKEEIPLKEKLKEKLQKPATDTPVYNPFLSALTNPESATDQSKEVEKEQAVKVPPQEPKEVEAPPPLKKIPYKDQTEKVQARKEKNLNTLSDLFDKHLQAYEQRMIRVVNDQINIVGETLTQTSKELAESIPGAVTISLRPRLVSFLERDFADRLQLYFQEIFKRIGETHQQGINYISEMHRLGKEKIDRIDQQVVLGNLARLEAVLGEIKAHLSTNPSETLKKIVEEAASKLEAIGVVIEETLRRQTETISEEGKHCEQLLERLETVRKLVSSEMSHSDKRKRYLRIRRSSD